MRYLVTVKEAAHALGVSERHIKKLVQEADLPGKSRWKFGRELVNLAPHGAKRRMVRVNLSAVVPGLELSASIPGGR